MTLLKENGLMIFLIFLILGIGLVAVLSPDSGSNGSRLPKLIEPTAAPSEESIEVNFEKEGNLVKQANDWVLVYEEPGKPALTVILDFTTCSECKPDEYEQGMRIEVKGDKSEDILKVAEIVKL